MILLSEMNSRTLLQFGLKCIERHTIPLFELFFLKVPSNWFWELLASNGPILYQFGKFSWRKITLDDRTHLTIWVTMGLIIFLGGLRYSISTRNLN